MKYLFVVAHPDDEVLGAGGLIHKLHRCGERVAVYVLNTLDTTRYAEDENGLIDDLKYSNDIIGTDALYTDCYRDSEFHNESHRDMVQSIEQILKEEEPNFVFTHHPADINSDHYWCSQSVQEAVRYGQRGRYDCKPIDGLFFMEVQSSTDWGTNLSLRKFEPNVFVEVEEGDIEKKIEALEVYENVIRPMPHPRSPETIRALSVFRGSQSGYPYAEAFQCAFRREI